MLVHIIFLIIFSFSGQAVLHFDEAQWRFAQHTHLDSTNSMEQKPSYIFHFPENIERHIFEQAAEDDKPTALQLVLTVYNDGKYRYTLASATCQ
jgi:hypothetical protein